jgi:hypothetical protein
MRVRSWCRFHHGICTGVKGRLGEVGRGGRRWTGGGLIGVLRKRRKKRGAKERRKAGS